MWTQPTFQWDGLGDLYAVFEQCMLWNMHSGLESLHKTSEGTWTDFQSWKWGRHNLRKEHLTFEKSEILQRSKALFVPVQSHRKLQQNNTKLKCAYQKYVKYMDVFKCDLKLSVSLPTQMPVISATLRKTNQINLHSRLWFSSFILIVPSNLHWC